MPTGVRTAYKAQAKARPSEAMSDQIIKTHRGLDRKGVEGRAGAARLTATLSNAMTSKRLAQTTDSNNP